MSDLVLRKFYSFSRHVPQFTLENVGIRGTNPHAVKNPGLTFKSPKLNY